MSHADVYGAVSKYVPCTHMEWPHDSAPDLPFACHYGEDDPFVADDMQIAVTHYWTVELYEKRRDKNLEIALSNELRAVLGNVSRDEAYIENDNMLEVIYKFKQIEGGFDG